MKCNHENTKIGNHERRNYVESLFRVFVLSCFRDKEFWVSVSFAMHPVP
jgi:hypothetical protein